MNEATKPFHLTITDNETGETVRELDFDALVGTAHTDECMVTGVYLTKCDVMTEAETLKGAENVLAALYDRNPLLRVAQTMFHADINEAEVEEFEESEIEEENQEENEEKGE